MKTYDSDKQQVNGLLPSTSPTQPVTSTAGSGKMLYTKNGQAVPADPSKIFARETSELDDADVAIVQGFFAKLLTIFGRGKYSAEFGDNDKPAMREWSHAILKHDLQYLTACLDYAAESRTGDTFICIPDILKGKPEPERMHPSHYPIKDSSLMIPRSRCPGTPKQMNLIDRDSRGYPIDVEPVKHRTISSALFERRRQQAIRMYEAAKDAG